MDSAIVEKERLQNFKLGNKLGSHSRNSSFSKSTTVNDFSHFSLPLTDLNGTIKPPRPLSLPQLADTNDIQNSANPVPSSKRNSHHRRRSSVSTRHESAELMGMTLSPVTSSEDNVNFGEKDSIRRRALWALEGKQDLTFNTVEIPDFSTSDLDKIISAKSALTPSSSSSYGNGLNLMNNKRDSFKLLAGSSSSKDQLHTLVEEEEEEEDDADINAQRKPEDSLPSPPPSVKENTPPSTSPFTMTPTLPVAVTMDPYPKPRPATLNLKPLSLTPDNLMTALPASFPTPSPSPRPGLRSLSLTPSSVGAEDPTTVDFLKQSRRGSLIVSPTPSSKRLALNLAIGQAAIGDVSGDGEEKRLPERRSSISYKRSSNGVTINPAGLPTPEMTPTFGRRFSTSGSINSCSEDDSLVFAPPTQTRPLSTSEQHFLFKSHNALLARITDLERTLSTRMRDSTGGFPRPLSVSSNLSSMSDPENRSTCSGVDSGPSDELLRLIADLKAERDELKRDVDGWKQRVNNLENQTVVLAKRLETERREAWFARSKAGSLEVERKALTKKLAEVDKLIRFHENEKEIWDKERGILKKEVEGYKERVGELKDELNVVKKELDCEKAKATYDPLATPTPNRSFERHVIRPMVVISPPPESTRTPAKKHGLGLLSDSESSTDVEPDSFDEHRLIGLKTVQEEMDGSYDDYEDDNGTFLTGYEDEEDMDDLSPVSSSSFGSEELLSSVQKPFGGLPPCRVFNPMQQQKPTHVPQSSLSMNWTFPKSSGSTAPAIKMEQEDNVDRFFGCLDDNESEAADGSLPSSFSYETSKGLFARGFALAPENDGVAFFLPSGVGVPAVEGPKKEKTQLEVVTEEEDEDEDEEVQSDFNDDEDVFGEDIGGIKITFTPARDDDDDEEEEEKEEEKEQIQVSPPRPKHTSPPPMLPALNFGGEDEDDPFNFGRPLIEEGIPPPPPEKTVLVSSPQSQLSPIAAPALPPTPAVISSPPAIPVAASSSSTRSSISHSSTHPPPSMIPRIASAKPLDKETAPATPPKRPSRANASGSASSTSSGKKSPSFIRQSSPSPVHTAPTPPPKSRPVPPSTFIRQPPLRKSTTTHSAKVQNAGSSYVPLDGRINVNSLNRSTTSERRPFASFFSSFINNPPVSKMKNVDLSFDDQPHTQLQNPTCSLNDNIPSTHFVPSVMLSSSTPPTRLSFQTLTNFVPWASRNRPTPQSPHPGVSKSDTLNNHGGGFISREKQLRRLQSRIDAEGEMVMKSCIHVQCKKCSGDFVFI